MRYSDITQDTFRAAMWPILVVAQCCGLMPVYEIGPLRSSSFRCLSLRLIVSIFYTVLGCFYIYMYVHRVNKIGASVQNMGTGIFLIFSTFCYILFIQLATKWEQFSEYWSRTEEIFLKEPYKVVGMKLITKIRVTAAVLLSFALSEQTFFFVQSVWSFALKINECNFEADEKLEQFMIMEYPYIFDLLPYSVPLSLLILWSDSLFVISWSLRDTFIILVSIGLAYRFKQINVRLRNMCQQHVSPKKWNEIRNHYLLWCELLNYVDKDMAPLILLSCLNNLYFICYQLMLVFKKLPYMLSSIYFWYSLLALFIRTVCVFVCAASINDAAKEPAQSIRRVSTTDWCEELSRFSEQVNSEIVALSGMKIFYLTRKLLLGMFGSIITYELVLMQFDQGTNQAKNWKPLPAFCHQ